MCVCVCVRSECYDGCIDVCACVLRHKWQAAAANSESYSMQLKPMRNCAGKSIRLCYKLRVSKRKESRLTLASKLYTLLNLQQVFALENIKTVPQLLPAATGKKSPAKARYFLL